MARWCDELQADLQVQRRRRLDRSLTPVDRPGRLVRRNGRTLLNLASNDYLALTDHPHLADAVARAAHEFGVGAGASRLVTGHLDLHDRLEQRFAEFKHAEAALLLPTGFMANLAVLTTFARPGDLVCLDKLNHASLIDAARASGADVRVFPHRHYDKLERLLDRSDAPRKLIVSDSVFSMDGDCADLAALVELRDGFDAILVVDEAHATGVLGERGSGLAEHQRLAGRIDVTISTASKALGSLGGLVTASRSVIETLVNRGRSFIYTTAAPPTQVAAIDAALDVIRDEPARRARVAELSRKLRVMLQERGWSAPDDPTPIVPVVVGAAERALELAGRLERAGILAPAIRAPTVPPHTARLRLSVRADLTDADLQQIVEALGRPDDQAGRDDGGAH